MEHPLTSTLDSVVAGQSLIVTHVRFNDLPIPIRIERISAAVSQMI